MPNQLQKGKVHLEDYIRSLQKYLGLLNKEHCFWVCTCGHHHVRTKMSGDEEEDSALCLQDDSIYIMFLECWGTLQVPVSGVIDRPCPTPFPGLRHAHFPGNLVLCSLTVVYVIATFSLPAIENLNYNLWVLCTAGLLACQLLKSAVALHWAPLTEPLSRGHQRIQKGWLGRPCGLTPRPSPRGEPGQAMYRGLPQEAWTWGAARSCGTSRGHTLLQGQAQHTSCYQDQMADCGKPA